MNNHLLPSHNFVAIDLEYADTDQNICQIGLAVVKNLEIVEHPSWKIQPPNNIYEDRYSRTHHLTSADTENAPTFKQVWREIKPYLTMGELWAHNAVSTEQPVLKKNLCYYGLDASWVAIYDSRTLFQRTDCPQNSGNTLELCCMALGIPFDEKLYHDASYDAVKCAEIVIAAAKGQQPNWNGIPKNSEQLRKQHQEKRVLQLGDFTAYYAGTSSGEEDVLCELASTYEGAVPQILDVFDKGDIIKETKPQAIDFKRLNTSEDNPLHGKKVVVTGLFCYERKDIEKAIAAMGAKKVPKPARNTDVVILGTRNVGFTKLIAIEEQEQKGNHLARIVGDEDLEQLLYGDGSKFFKL